MGQLLEKAERLQELLLSYATDGPGDDNEYRQLRQVFLSDPTLAHLVPSCVRSCRSLGAFGVHIKRQSSTWRGRRALLYEAFQPLLDHLELEDTRPSDEPVSQAFKILGREHVDTVWSKALERRQTDPEGALTAARTLLETVCKLILDELAVPYDDGAELPKLYRATAEALSLAPSQHTEEIFKQILGGCTAVVEGLGSLRNKLSDAHGKGKKPVKPAPRHAELAVNLAGAMAAGAMASFLVATLEARKEAEAQPAVQPDAGPP